jgi:hypothetical protein
MSEVNISEYYRHHLDLHHQVIYRLGLNVRDPITWSTIKSYSKQKCRLDFHSFFSNLLFTWRVNYSYWATLNWKLKNLRKRICWSWVNEQNSIQLSWALKWLLQREKNFSSQRGWKSIMGILNKKIVLCIQRVSILTRAKNIQDF